MSGIMTAAASDDPAAGSRVVLRKNGIPGSSSCDDISSGNRAGKSASFPVETEGYFPGQPGGILKAFIYRASIEEPEGQIKRRKTGWDAVASSSRSSRRGRSRSSM